MPLFNEEFRLYSKRVLPLAVILLFLPLVSFLVWIFTPARQLEVVVIDKTVPNTEYREHQVIFWVLEHLKFQNKGQEFYRKASDYFGFHPDESPGFGVVKDFREKNETEIKTMVSGTDLVYVADTYGVFEDDFLENPSETPSKKIYGGLDRSDMILLSEAKAQGKTIVAEFNSMATPTPLAIRSEFQNLMGLKWTGWIARYFDELDTLRNRDIPDWLITQYLDQHGNTWVPAGPGLVFVHEDGKVEIFSDKVDYLSKIPKIRTQRINTHGFKLPEVVPYPDWFDIVLIERDYQVVSYYDIEPTVQGTDRLKAMGLPRFFPTVVFKDTGKGELYYFAGDFADHRSRLGSARFTGLPVLWRGFHLVTDHTDREGFFWNYYYPLFSRILEKAYNRKENG